MAVVSLFAVIVVMAGPVDAQRTRYTIDDVMDKLIEVDKRLVAVETDIKNIKADMKNIKADMKEDKAELREQISDVNTVTITFFTVLSVLFGGILAFVFSIARNMRPPESSKAFRKEVREIAERERALEEKLQAEDRRVPKETKILEALEQKVSALAERQKELEGKLKLAEVI